jgi:hypothetical protein
MTSRYTNLSLTELEAEQAALECALVAKGGRIGSAGSAEYRAAQQAENVKRREALDTLLAIDGELYDTSPHIKQGDKQ